MCQLIVKPAGVTIDKSILHDAWVSNDDGAGFAWRDPDTLKIWYQKGFFKFKKFWKAYQRVQHLDTLIHFRLATHGLKDESNTHPFVVGSSGAVMAHNGILYSYAPVSKTDTRSDTRIFIDTLITPILEASKLPVDQFFGEYTTKVWLETYTKGNKFAVLAPGGFYIFNEGAGTWKDKVWYSAGYPPDEKMWSWEYDWRAALDRRWGKGGSSYWEQDLARYTSKGQVALCDSATISSKGYIDVDSTPERYWDRCQVCSEASRILYRMNNEEICPECWHMFNSATGIEG